MSHAIRGLIFTLALVMGSACGVSTPSSSSTSNSSQQVSMPTGFPSDFPVYPGARLTMATSTASSGATTWDIEWDTGDDVGKVQAFYTAKLAQGDWTQSFSGNSNGGFSAIFNRKSTSTAGGILLVDGSSGITKISLALTNGG